MFAAVLTIHQLYNPGTLGMVNIIRFARRFFRLRSNSTWISSLRAARSQGCFNKPRRQKDIQVTQDHRGICIPFFHDIVPGGCNHLSTLCFINWYGLFSSPTKISSINHSIFVLNCIWHDDRPQRWLKSPLRNTWPSSASSVVILGCAKYQK